MKNLILLFALLICGITFAQQPDRSVSVHAVKKLHISTATRDTYVVPVGETWEIFNTTTGQKERNEGGAGWVIDEGTAATELTGVATSTIIGRITAGSGVSEELTATQVRTLLNVEDGATADQSDAEIETAYNNQVPIVSQAAAEAGTSTTAERWTPQRVAQAIAAIAPAGGTDDQTAAEVSMADVGLYYTGTDVEAMGQEIGASLATKLAVDQINTFAELNAIVADETLVNTNDAQTLTGKTINADNNTITNISNGAIKDNTILYDDLFIENGTETPGHLLAISTVSNRFDLIDPATLGGGGDMNDLIDDLTPTFGGDVDAADKDITDLNLLRISNTTGANTMSLNFIADADTAFQFAPLGGPAMQYSFVSGGWTYPILDTADYFTANNVETALAELGAGVAAGTDDQTAAEVPFADGNGNFNATNVEDALDELVPSLAYAITSVSGVSAASITYTNGNVNEGDSNAQRNKSWSQHTKNDTIVLDATITEYKSPFVIQPWGADSLYIKKGTSTTFYVPEQTAAVSENGIIVKGRNPLTVVPMSSNVFFIAGNYETLYDEITAYSINNEYLEASAMNADNYTAGIGSWTMQNGSSTTAISATTDAPSVTLGSEGSVRYNEVSANATARMQIVSNGTNISNLTTSADYIVRFYYKRVDGDTAGTGMQFRVDQTADHIEVVTTAETGAWTLFTSSTWTADVTNPNFWITGSAGATATDDFYISNFEIVEQP